MKKRYQGILFFLIVSFIFVHSQIFASKTTNQEINQWLMLGPGQVPTIEKDFLGDNKSILDFNHLNVSDLFPIQGSSVSWASGQALQWRVIQKPEFTGYDTGVAYLATYLEPTRWLKTTLNIHHTSLGVSVYLDGQLRKAQLDKEKIIAPLELTNEKHLLVLKILLLKGTKYTFKATLDLEEPFENEIIAQSMTPQHKIKTENILNIISVKRIWVSPNGRRVALSLEQTNQHSGTIFKWIEILNTYNKQLIFSSWNYGKISKFRWLDGSSYFSYTMTKNEKTTIFKYDLNTNQQKVLLKEIKNFYDYWWASSGAFLIYSTYEKDEQGEYKYIKELNDRTEYSGYHYSMFIHYLNNNQPGVTHALTNKEQDFYHAMISPDNQYILFLKNEEDTKTRPFSKNSYFLLDVKTFLMEKLFESNWIGAFGGNNSVSWSPDSKKLLLLGGCSAFDGLGRNLPENKISNDYDIQAYIYDVKSKNVTPISKQFNPSIKTCSWSSSYSQIYFHVTDRSDAALYKFYLKNNRYQRLNTNISMIKEIDFASKRNLAVYWGSSADKPHKLYMINLSSGNVSILKDYNREQFIYVKLGQVKEWNFKTDQGKTIMGRIHYPPDFNPANQYPCIVYYYGGTNPVYRRFGGRYPANWYSANGYIVYVLQPSGAIGFGQESSAIHVNDWGKTTSSEIIAGVKQLIKEHKYIDPQRIGAMGASYGGFMTQYLAAHTDIFAAYISHAGISSITSYWGVGDWGIYYNSVAAANSFPWNRKDIYVGNSPLFMAERINKPLLLLHGSDDNNVPPGESYQMFAALKLQNKEVELITYKGQKHWITEYKKRLHWMRTIIAWWDKHLKNQPQHWEHMFQK